MNKLKAIQGLVIVMTSLIIAGVGAVIYGLANNEETLKETVNTVTIITKEESVILSEPRGSKIENIQTCGNNLCLLITGGATPDRIVIIDSKGNIVRKVVLEKKAKKSKKDYKG